MNNAPNGNNSKRNADGTFTVVGCVMEPIKLPPLSTTVKALYSFRFTGGGMNAVWAFSMDEARVTAAKEFTSPNLKIDRDSFQRRASKDSQNAYWASLPLMD